MKGNNKDLLAEWVLFLSRTAQGGVRISRVQFLILIATSVLREQFVGGFVSFFSDAKAYLQL